MYLQRCHLLNAFSLIHSNKLLVLLHFINYELRDSHSRLDICICICVCVHCFYLSCCWWFLIFLGCHFGSFLAPIALLYDYHFHRTQPFSAFIMFEFFILNFSVERINCSDSMRKYKFPKLFITSKQIAMEDNWSDGWFYYCHNFVFSCSVRCFMYRPNSSVTQY